MKTEVLFSSDKSEWSTPQWLYDQLDGEFRFQLDAAASAENHKCEAFFTKEEDALSKPWAERTFVNPPYGRDIGKWVQKAQRECNKGKTVVMILPARVDTSWFHRWIYHRHEVRFMNGRIKFGGSKNNAPFPTMVVIMRGAPMAKEDS